jgi:hypothetical protein
MGSRQGLKPFDLRMSNIPLMNLREEFRASVALVRQRKFEDYFANTHIDINAPSCTWYGRSEEFLTILLQRAIVGIESYLPSAVSFTGAMRNRIDIIKSEAIRDPFVLQGRGTAENLYNRLPALLEPKLALKEYDARLWEKTRLFYREIRNPIFHGSELEPKKGEFRPIRAAFNHIENLYGWIDDWFSMRELADWAISNNAIPKARAVSQKKSIALGNKTFGA